MTALGPRVLSVMRQMRSRSDALYAQSQRLSPPPGSVALGGSHIDPFAKAEALAGLLRGLGDGLSLDAAEQMGAERGRLVIERWNASRTDVVVHRSTGEVERVAREARRDVERAMQVDLEDARAA